MMQSNPYMFLGLIKKAGRLSSGDETVEIDIKKGKCKLLVIANDSSENTKKRFENLAKRHNINYVTYGEKNELGLSIGKGPTAVVSINDFGFASEFLKKTNQNNNGGEGIVKN